MTGTLLLIAMLVAAGFVGWHAVGAVQWIADRIGVLWTLIGLAVAAWVGIAALAVFG